MIGMLRYFKKLKYKEAIFDKNKGSCPGLSLKLKKTKKNGILHSFKL